MTSSNARRVVVVAFLLAALGGPSQALAQYQPQPYQPQPYQPQPYQPQPYRGQPYGPTTYGQPRPYGGYGPGQPYAPQQPAARGAALPIRRLFLGAGLGFGVTFEGGQAYFRLEEHLGYHVFGVAEHPGLFLALTLVQGIASQVILDFAGRIGFDAVAWQDSHVRVLVTPSVGLGVGLFIVNGYGESVYPGAFIMPALEVQLVAVDGFMTVWYRPIGFDILARDNGNVAYTMMLGVNLNL